MSIKSKVIFIHKSILKLKYTFNILTYYKSDLVQRHSLSTPFQGRIV